jgi:membrane protein
MLSHFDSFKAIFLHVFKKFSKDRCLSISAELTITTLFALVPLLTLIIQLANAFPAFGDLTQKLQQVAFEYMLPQSVDSLAGYLNEFVAKAKGMSSIGLILLILSAITLLKTIEKSFNTIWGVKDDRRTVTKLMVYWALLTIGPLFMGASIGLTTYITSMPYISDVIQETRFITGYFVPVVFAWIGFTCLFWFVPNAPVNAKDALISAAVTAIVFELTKRGFVLFVEKFSTYHVVFGALALLPLLIIWLQIVWSITLLGAQLCYSLSHNIGSNQGKMFNPLLVAWLLLQEIKTAQESSDCIDRTVLVRKNPLLSPVQTDQILQTLIQSQIVKVLRDQKLCLLKPVTFHKLLTLSKFNMPDEEAKSEFLAQFDIDQDTILPLLEAIESQAQPVTI